MKTNFSVEELKKAINIALEEYDKETILDIVTQEESGWSNGTEALNEVNPVVVRRILYTEY